MTVEAPAALDAPRVAADGGKVHPEELPEKETVSLREEAREQPPTVEDRKLGRELGEGAALRSAEGRADAVDFAAGTAPAQVQLGPVEDATTRSGDLPPGPVTAVPVAPPVGVKVDDSKLPPLLFEVGWEVCWQLGGIYTVLRSKAPAMLARWGDGPSSRYTLVGPYNPKTAAMEFEPTEPEGIIREAIGNLADRGIIAHHGRWLIAGRPRAILIDYRPRYMSMDADKYLLWKDHGIVTDNNDGEVNEVVAFGFACTMFFEELTKVANGRPLIAHFHEWMGGVAVPRIAHERLPIRTVFTTHATLLGRYLAGDNPYFYDHLPFVDPDKEAQHFNIYPRYRLEKAAAHSATVFTTVSEVTAMEAEKLLGRAPDVIMPNGLNIQRFQATHEFQNLHNYYKERIHDFVRGHFFPSYSFDLDNTIYLLTSGRYEYRNKGMDLYIEALYRLNQRLKEWKVRPTIVAFIITRAPVKNINVRTLQSQTMYEDLRHVCEEIQTQMGSCLFRAAASGRMPKFEELLPDDSAVRLKRAITAMRSYELPTIVTHDMVDDAKDAVLTHLRHRGMFNRPDDPVKVVFHPDFVTATSPLLGLDYEQFVRGCHMGLFPSYYEPWGYTPMECNALGIPAVTTDLSGFGAYVQKHVELAAMQGIMVVRRRGRGFDAVVEDLVDHLLNFCRMNRRQRVDQRNRVERLSEMFDWSTLVRHYHEAHDLALSRGQTVPAGKVDIVMV
jgi:glycogen(starch) synthase